MKMKKIAMACGAALMGATSLAQAEFSANVALTSDYVFRGFTQNGGDMAIQGGFDYSHESGFYAGVWASNVDESVYGGASIEADVYVGYATEVAGFGLDAALLRYNYPGTSNSANNTNEIAVSVSKDFGMASASVGLAHSPDFFGTGSSNYYSFGVDVPAGPATVSATYGIQTVSGGADTKDWSLGVSGELEGFGLALTYADNNTTGGCDGAGGSCVAFTVSKEF